MTPLCELAMKYGTDKCPHHKGLRPGHSYTPFYQELFWPIRNHVRTVLEIGIETGASLRMWEEFFPNADIIGLDNDSTTLFATDRIMTSTNAKMLADFYDPFDIVIDDASHKVEDCIYYVKLFAPQLIKGGFYIIEDVQSQAVGELQAALNYNFGLEVVEFNKNFPTGDDRLIVVRT